MYIFFRRQHALEDFEEVTNKMTKKVLLEYYGLENYVQSKSKLPVILGSATDWKPAKMIPALYHTMLCLTKQMQKSKSVSVLEALPKMREELEMVLNQPDMRAYACPEESPRCTSCSTLRARSAPERKRRLLAKMISLRTDGQRAARPSR